MQTTKIKFFSEYTFCYFVHFFFILNLNFKIKFKNHIWKQISPGLCGRIETHSVIFQKVGWDDLSFERSIFYWNEKIRILWSGMDGQTGGNPGAGRKRSERRSNKFNDTTLPHKVRRKEAFRCGDKISPLLLHHHPPELSHKARRTSAFMLSTPFSDPTSSKSLLILRVLRPKVFSIFHQPIF